MSDTSLSTSTSGDDGVEYVGQTKYRATVPVNTLIRKDKDVAEIARSLERAINALPLGTQASPSFHPSRFGANARGWWDMSQYAGTDGEALASLPNLINPTEEDEELVPTTTGITYSEESLGAVMPGGTARLNIFHAAKTHMREWFGGGDPKTVFIVAESGSDTPDQVLLGQDNASFAVYGFTVSPSTGPGVSDRELFYIRETCCSGGAGTDSSGKIICATGDRRIYWFTNEGSTLIFGDDQGRRFTAEDFYAMDLDGSGTADGSIGGCNRTHTGNGFIGVINEVINWGSVLDGDALNNAIASLAAKWNLTVPVPTAEVIGGTPIEITEGIDADLQAHKALTTTAHGGIPPSPVSEAAGQIPSTTGANTYALVDDIRTFVELEDGNLTIIPDGYPAILWDEDLNKFRLGYPAADLDVTTFTSTGTTETWTVPTDITQIIVTLVGAKGGGASTTQGNGGLVKALVDVTPGDDVFVRVGGLATGATGGFNGGGNGGTTSTGATGGGGGASDIRIGGTTLGDRVLVAAGGGGQGAFGSVGGSGGAATGGDASGGRPGLGGTQTTGGAAGAFGTTNGSLGVGGIGANENVGGGGGGGGLYGGGGGGGGSATDGGGGGGSNYIDPSVIAVASLREVVASPHVTVEYVIGGGGGGGGGPVALDDLTDVVITTPADLDVLTYDSGSGDWLNLPATGGGGGGGSVITYYRAIGDGGGNYSTSSTSYVPIDATDLSLDIDVEDGDTLDIRFGGAGYVTNGDFGFWDVGITPPGGPEYFYADDLGRPGGIFEVFGLAGLYSAIPLDAVVDVDITGTWTVRPVYRVDAGFGGTVSTLNDVSSPEDVLSQLIVTHTTPGSGGGGGGGGGDVVRSYDSQRVVAGGGYITGCTATLAVMPIDPLVLSADEGDLATVHFGVYWEGSSDGFIGIAFLDADDDVIRRWGDTSIFGLSPIGTVPSGDQPVSGSYAIPVEAGDIVAGTVRVGLEWRQGSGSGKRIYADTDTPLHLVGWTTGGSGSGGGGWVEVYNGPDGTLDGWTSSGGTWTATGDVIEQTSTAGSFTHLYRTFDPLSPTTRVHVTMLVTPGGTQDFYAGVGFGTNSTVQLHRQTGAWFLSWSSTTTVTSTSIDTPDLGDPMDLVITVTGNVAMAHLNGDLIDMRELLGTDERPSMRTFQLMTYATEIAFSDITIHSYDLGSP